MRLTEVQTIGRKALHADGPAAVTWCEGAKVDPLSWDLMAWPDDPYIKLIKAVVKAEDWVARELKRPAIKQRPDRLFGYARTLISFKAALEAADQIEIRGLDE